MALTLLLGLLLQDATAQEHYDRSRQLAAQGLFEDAISELEAAEKLAPSATIAYELALAYGTVDRCQAAIEAYRRYLRLQPAAENRVEVQRKISEQTWRLSHNECKDAPPKPAATPGEPVRRRKAEAEVERPSEPVPHYGFGIGARMGIVLGRVGSSQELVGSEGYTPIENVAGYHLSVAFQLPIVRGADRRPLLQIEPFFALSYYGFNEVELVDASNHPLTHISGGDAKLPIVGGAVRGSIAVADKWSLVPAVGGGVGWQMISLQTDACRLSSSLASGVMTFDLPFRYDAEPHHAIYFTPAHIDVIFPPGSDGDPVDATCFGLPGGQLSTKALWELDKTKVNYSFDGGYMFQF